MAISPAEKGVWGQHEPNVGGEDLLSLRGNLQDMAPVAPGEERRSLGRVLIPNRGVVAEQALRELHKRGIPTTLMYWNGDQDTLPVKRARILEPTTGGLLKTVSVDAITPLGVYNDVDVIAGIARKEGCSTVDPLWGFWAEGAKETQFLRNQKLIVVAPDTQSIRQLGEKKAALELAEKLEISTLKRIDGTKPLETFLREAEEIGFPLSGKKLLAKITTSGSGRGHRIISTVEELGDAHNFYNKHVGNGNGRVQWYAEEFLEDAKHIEVQIMGDGQIVIPVDVRECSAQTKHSKRLEESPASIISIETRQRIINQATRFAKGYKGSGTIEFLVDSQGNPYFIEMNTRLQVEHPVSQLATGWDILGSRYSIAQGGRIIINQGQEESPIKLGAIEVRLMMEPGEITSMGIPPAGFKNIQINPGYWDGDTMSERIEDGLAALISAPYLLLPEAEAEVKARLRAIRRLHEALGEIEKNYKGPRTNLGKLMDFLSWEPFLDCSYTVTDSEKFLAV